MSVDIAYVVSHGFASRMLTQTDLLGRLRRSGATVAVISPDRNDPVLAKYCAAHDILLEEFVPRLGAFSDDYLFRRRYYLEDIRSNPAVWEKHLAVTRFHPPRNPFRRLRAHWYSLMYRLIPRFPSIRRRFIESEWKYLHSPEAEALIARLAPRKLISTYPVTLAEATLLHYGNRHPDVETWIHLLSWDNITCKGRFVEVADRYIAWGPVMRDELRAHYGVGSDRVAECGVPHFDVHRDPRMGRLRPEVLATVGIDASKPYAVFAMSSPRFAPNEIDVVEWLAKKIARGELGDLQLLVRPHPQNVEGNMSDASWLPRLRALTGLDGVAVAFPKLVRSRLRWSMEEIDMLELAAMLSGAAAVLNSGSTVSIDALMHARPVLITAFDADVQRDYWNSARRLMDYPHLQTFQRLGGVVVTRDFASLERELRAVIADPGPVVARGQAALEAECGAPDGQATQRVVEVLTTAQTQVVEAIA